jgi:hypothetical protein
MPRLFPAGFCFHPFPMPIHHDLFSPVEKPEEKKSRVQVKEEQKEKTNRSKHQAKNEREWFRP